MTPQEIHEQIEVGVAEIYRRLADVSLALAEYHSAVLHDARHGEHTAGEPLDVLCEAWGSCLEHAGRWLNGELVGSEAAWRALRTRWDGDSAGCELSTTGALVALLDSLDSWQRPEKQ